MGPNGIHRVKLEFFAREGPIVRSQAPWPIRLGARAIAFPPIAKDRFFFLLALAIEIQSDAADSHEIAKAVRFGQGAMIPRFYRRRALRQGGVSPGKRVRASTLRKHP